MTTKPALRKARCMTTVRHTTLAERPGARGGTAPTRLRPNNSSTTRPTGAARLSVSTWLRGESNTASACRRLLADSCKPLPSRVRAPHDADASPPPPVSRPHASSKSRARRRARASTSSSAVCNRHTRSLARPRVSQTQLRALQSRSATRYTQPSRWRSAPKIAACAS